MRGIDADPSKEIGQIVGEGVIMIHQQQSQWIFWLYQGQGEP